MSDCVDIKLTKNEAWVLFEIVRRFSNTDCLTIEDQSEERALWNLCCIFEKSLHQDENIEYADFLEKQRSKLRDIE